MYREQYGEYAYWCLGVKGQPTWVPADYFSCCMHLCTACKVCLSQSVIDRLPAKDSVLWLVSETSLVPHTYLQRELKGRNKHDLYR